MPFDQSVITSNFEGIPKVWRQTGRVFAAKFELDLAKGHDAAANNQERCERFVHPQR